MAGFNYFIYCRRVAPDKLTVNEKCCTDSVPVEGIENYR